MKSFQWNQYFETDIPRIDEQHQRLVDIINNFGSLIIQNRLAIEDIQSVLDDLIQYAQSHFNDEEHLMDRLNLDSRHTEHHRNEHARFLMEVTLMRSGMTEEDPDSSHALLNFLTAWLAYHILEIDQNMAGQVKIIKSGTLPPAAYLEEKQKKHSATGPLLGALRLLFQQVSNRNRDLVKLNHSLEAKVAERTMDLFEANMKLEKLSLTDSLTELPNRRHAMESLKHLWKESSDTNTDLSCMMVDADRFKQVNDTHGHAAGDQVLIKLSHQLQHSVRNDDLVCRMGGDEFLILCPNTPKNGALHLAELIRKEVSTLFIPLGDCLWQCSVSVGVATRSAKTATMEDLIKAADKGVYAAKASGRNCVSFSEVIREN